MSAIRSLALGRRFFEKPTSIGVEFDGDRIHWAQLERGPRSLRLRDACSVKHDGDLEALLASKRELKGLVDQVMRRCRFRGRRIVTHPPGEHLRLMVLNYTADESISEAQQVMDLCRERMRSDLLGHVVDFVRIRTSGQQQGDRSVLVAAAPEEPVLEHLERLRRAGLEVEAMEIAPMAVRRLIAAIAPDPADLKAGEIALVLRMRATSTELTLLSGQRLLLYREIGIGTDAIIQAVAKGLDSELEAARDLLALYGVGLGGGPVEAEASSLSGDSDEVCGTLRDIVRPSLRALIEQAHKAISYAAFQTRGTSIEQVYLLEGGASCPGFDGLLSEMLQLPVEFLRPLGRIEAARGSVPVVNEARIAVALGFSMRGLIDV